jgi:hypothetical protein
MVWPAATRVKMKKRNPFFFYKSGKGKMKESTKSETMTMMTEKIQPYLKLVTCARLACVVNVL